MKYNFLNKFNQNDFYFITNIVNKEKYVSICTFFVRLSTVITIEQYNCYNQLNKFIGKINTHICVCVYVYIYMWE